MSLFLHQTLNLICCGLPWFSPQALQLHSSVFVTVYECSLIPNHTLTSSSGSFVVSNGFLTTIFISFEDMFLTFFIINFIEKCVCPMLVKRVVFDPTSVYLAACQQLRGSFHVYGRVTSYILNNMLICLQRDY